MGATDGRVRAFAAIELDAATREAVANLIARLRPQLPGIAWTRPDNAHVTLRFLGDVSEKFLEQYSQQLHASLAPYPAVHACVAGVGAFPTLARPTVLWAGISMGAAEITVIQHEFERAARVLGLAPETRAFTPHVTLGRLKRGARSVDAKALLNGEREFRAHEFVVDGVSLFSSELTQHGARHTRLYEVPLNGVRSQSGL